MDSRSDVRLPHSVLLALWLGRHGGPAASAEVIRHAVQTGADELPVGLAPRALRAITQAARLRAIVRLATTDDGGAINLWQADQRSTALREVDRAARRAMSAATVDVTHR